VFSIRVLFLGLWYDSRDGYIGYRCCNKISLCKQSIKLSCQTFIVLFVCSGDLGVYSGAICEFHIQDYSYNFREKIGDQQVEKKV